MKLFDKVKNFFYDDEIEEDEEEIEVPIKTHQKEKKQKPKEEISERELFKAERTFNFPMDVDDDTLFDIPKKSINEEKVKIDTKVTVNSYRSSLSKNTTRVGTRAYSKTEPKKEEIKKFRPTPIISPIYGVLDKNYKKEDLMVDSALESSTKKLDYDTVRQRAYGNIYKTEVEDDKTSEEETKGIFYNLDEEENDDNNDNVKIIYNDVTFDDEIEDDNNKTTKEEINEKNQTDEEDNILSETKEQDLFNLIDNMYNSEDDEEEEEE